MIVTKEKTSDITKLTNSLYLINEKVYFNFVNGNWFIFVGIDDNDLLVANSASKIGYSTLYGTVYVTGLQTGPTEPRFLLLEDDSFVLLEDDGKIQLQRS